MRIALSIIFVFFASVGFAKTCMDDRVFLEWEKGSASFKVDVVDTPEGRAQGLMFVESMPRFSGMLFVYEKPQPQIAFWMRNTLIPLDILFFDKTGVLKTIQENAIPLDETSLPGGSGIQYVLEINGGMAETLRIPEGAVLVSNRIAPELAAMPCIAAE